MITPLYAAIAALIFIALSFLTIALRRKLGIAIGTGNNQKMARAIAAHSNFAQYTAITLLLVYFLESRVNSPVLIHILCICFIIGRLLHAYGISQAEENFKFRVSGMILTIGCIISASVRIILSYIY